MNLEKQIEEARKVGYTDKEILLQVQKKHSLSDDQIRKALASGHTEADIISHFATVDVTPKIEAPKRQPVPKWGQKNPNLYGAFGAGKELWNKVVKPTAHGLGMMGGSAAGIPSGPAGMVAGGGLGYSITKKVTDIVDRKIASLEGIRSKTTLQKELMSSLYDVKEGVQMEMMGQGAGKILHGTAQKIAAPVRKQMTWERKVVEGLAKKRGIELTSADLTGHKGWGLFESVLDRAPGSSQVMSEFRTKAQLEPLLKELDQLKTDGGSKMSIENTGRKIWERVTEHLKVEENLRGDALNRVRTKVLAKIGTTASYAELGITGKELLKAKSIAMRDRATEAFKDVGKSAPGEHPTPNLEKVARKHLGRLKKLAGNDNSLMTQLKWSANELDVPPRVQEQLDALPTAARREILAELEGEAKRGKEWTTLSDFRAKLNSLISKESEIGGYAQRGMAGQTTPEGRTYTLLKKALDSDMRNIAQKTGGETWDKYELANALWGKFSEIYKAPVIRRIAKADPNYILDMAFKKGGVAEVQTIKKALGLEGFTGLREGFTNRILGVGKHEVFDPKYLRQQLINYEDALLNEVYGKGAAKTLHSIAKEGLDLSIQKPGISFLKSISKQYPETVVDSIIGAPESKLASVTMIRNIEAIKKVLPKEARTELSDLLTEKLMAKGQTGDNLSPKAFSSMVDKYGKRVLSRFYPKSKVDELLELSNIAKKMDRANRVAEGTGQGSGMLVTWGIGRMMMQSASGRKIGAVLAFGPSKLAKIYTSQNGLKLLKEGFTVPKWTKRATEIYTKLSLIAGKEEGATK